MTKRKFAWGLAIILLAVSVLGIGWSVFGKNEISMSQASLQQRIDEKMPHVTKGGVTISKVTLDLSGDRIGLTVAAQATKFKQNFDAVGGTKGSLRYNPVEGSFYFHPDDLDLTSLSVNGESTSSKVSRFIEKYVDSPKLNEHKAEIASTAQAAVKDMVLYASEKTLEHVPVYKLPNDFKGNVARMFLTKVEVKDGNIIAHLSFWQFTKMVAFYAFVLVLSIAMAVALLMNPEWGMAFLFLGAISGN